MLEHHSEGLLICRIGCAKRRHGRQSYPTSTLMLPLCGMLVVCRIAKQRMQELRIRDPRKYSLLVRRQGLGCLPEAARRLPAVNVAMPLLLTSQDATPTKRPEHLGQPRAQLSQETTIPSKSLASTTAVDGHCNLPMLSALALAESVD